MMINIRETEEKIINIRKIRGKLGKIIRVGEKES